MCAILRADVYTNDFLSATIPTTIRVIQFRFCFFASFSFQCVNDMGSYGTL